MLPARPRTRRAAVHGHAVPLAVRRVALVAAPALAVALLTSCAALGGGPGPGSHADSGGSVGADDADASTGSGRGVRSAAPSGTPAPSESPAAAAEPTSLPSFDASSTVGDYAPGFPVDLLGAPDDATVLASSATPGDGKLLDVSLNLSTERSTQEVVDQVAAPLLDAGFEESEATAFSGLSAQTTYTRTKKAKKPSTETVVVGVLDSGERRLVTISGSVLA